LNTLGVPKRRSWAHLGRFGVDFFKQRQAAAMMSDFCIFSNSFWPPRGRLGNVLGDLGGLLGDLDGFCDFWNNPNDFWNKFSEKTLFPVSGKRVQKHDLKKTRLGKIWAPLWKF